LIRFSLAQTEDEYKQVLDLRFREYLSTGKVPLGRTPQDMADSVDPKSQILIGKHGDKVVCSIRLLFHVPGDALTLEKFVAWPDQRPPSHEIAEVSRACVHRDFRGTDLFLSLLKLIGIEVVRRNVNWTLIDSTEEMIPFYRKIGFKSANLSYTHPGLNSKVHHVLLLHVRSAVLGREINPIYWNLTWRKLYETYGADWRRDLSSAERLRASVQMRLGHFSQTLLESNFVQKNYKRLPLPRSVANALRVFGKSRRLREITHSL
jgi:predicted GNAT family N-acyltransferase